MSFWNNWGDLWGDVKAIATGHNPMNQPPPVSAPPPKGPTTLPVAGGPVGTGQQSYGNSSDPTDPTYNPDDPQYDNGNNGPGQPDPTDPTGGSSGGGGGFDWGGFIKQYGGDIGKAITGFAKNYGTTALEAWNIYNAAQQNAQAKQYASEALNGISGQPGTGALAQYAAKQPLRTAGIAGMLNPSANAPNLSSIRNIAGANSGNPFAGALPVASGRGQSTQLISNGPQDRTPTPSTPTGPMGGQTLFGGTLPVANGPTTAPQSAGPPLASQGPTLPVAQTPQTPVLQKPSLPTLPFAPVNRTAGQGY